MEEAFPPTVPGTGSEWPWNRPPPVPSTHYLDNRIYTDPAVFAREREHIFKQQWKFVCHESELPRPGDYRCVDVADVPLFVVRDEAGELRAFFNICPHRGARLLREVRGQLQSHRLTCFYHHWSFSSSGQAVALPLPQGYQAQAIAAKDIGLRSVRIASRLGLVFVRIEDGARPASLNEFLGPALDQLAEPIADLEVFHYHRVEIKANWKLFVETNCEGYHELLHLLNRTTALSQREYLKRKWLLHPGGHHTFQPANIAYGKLNLQDRNDGTLPGMSPNMHIVTDVFPDVMINARSTVVRIDSLIPLAPDRTVLECRGLAPRGDSEAQRRLRIRQHNEVWGPMGRNLPEDIWAIETQWPGMVRGKLPFSLIAREDDDQATDNSPLRSFYARWEELTGLPAFDIDAAGLAAREVAK